MNELVWVDDVTCRVGDTEFFCKYPAQKGSVPERFVVLKTRPVVERYRSLLEDLRPRRILEFGVFDGGSTALLSLWCEPDLLVAIDLEPDPAPALESFLDAHDLHDTVKCHFGLDQSDLAGLDAMIEESIGQEPLDLIIDDASHIVAPTRVSFDRTFPLLRPGGLFVLEDWSGAHRFENMLSSRMARDESFASDFSSDLRRTEMSAPTPLSFVVFQIVLAAAFQEDVVADVTLNHSRVVIERGPADLDPHTFRLANTYGKTGTRILETLEAVWPPS